MELLSKEDICYIVKQLGYKEASSWSVKKYSNELIGYLGEHLTLTVEVESGTVLQFFVKCLPRFDEWKIKYLRETTFFEKEHAMLNSLFKDFGQGTRKWRPDTYFVKEELFVFEDVVQLGYTMPHNQDTLTVEQVRACIETMARFHAQSYIYEEKRSKVLKRPYRIWEDYRNYLQEPDKSQNWRNAGMNAVISFMKEYSKFKTHPNFVQKVESAVPKLFNSALSLTQPDKRYRNVVVHRDLWMNNIFFKKESDGSLYALFVDFQTVIYCSPMLDFSSFIYINTRRQFRKHYLPALIDLYFSSLSLELKGSNINVLDVTDKESLKACYKDTVIFGISQAALIVPITIISKDIKENIFFDSDKVNNFYEVSRSQEFIDIARTDERYRNHVTELFDEIVERYILN